MRGKKALKNIGYMTIAQVFVMLLSIGMSVFVPKFVGITEFSYWQLFIFYASYTGCLHLGLNDGIYLQQAGKQLTSEKRISISNQLWTSIIVQTICLGILFLLLSSLEKTPERRIVYMFICIYAIINNIFNYCGSVLQSINQIKKYSQFLLVDKIFVILFIFTVILLKQKSFEILICGYILGRLIALTLLLCNFRSIFLCSFKPSYSVLMEMIQNIGVGYNLMIANIASSFVLGVGRFIIDLNYPIEVFGKVSFALTLTGFVLSLISQVGNSVFPILASKDMDFHKKTLPQVESLLQIVLPVSYLAYPFIYCLIHYYLPQYCDSLLYFTILFPLCVFEAKISMLYNTYMKVLRLERNLLLINIVSVIISGVLASISCYVFHSILMVVLSLVLAVIIKAMILRNTISRKLEIQVKSPYEDLFISIVIILWLYFSTYNTLVTIFVLFAMVGVYEVMTYKQLRISVSELLIKK